MGCFAKGCLILCAFFFLLGVAFVGGTYWAMRYLRTEFFPQTAAELPPATPTEPEQQAAQEKWRTFETHARAHESARLELTEQELNALIASESALRGKAFVSLDGDVARLKVSIPLGQMRWMEGHYLNGECSVQSSPTGDPGGVRITNIIVNGRTVAEETMQWQYGPWSVRRYINDWTADQNVKSFEIRDSRVILESKAE